MYKSEKIIAIITARGGSKGIPGKNIHSLAGKPLINWTIEAAKESKYIDRVILSTDSEEIIDVAKRVGCEVPFVRPADLARDCTSSMDVILHALSEVGAGYEHFVLLQPTSPLRNAHHIDTMIESYFAKGLEFMVSVCPIKHPAFIYTIEGGYLKSFVDNRGVQLRRQDMAPAYEHNGAIYIANIESFKQRPTFNHGQIGAFEMSGRDSVDIDTEMDFILAEAYLKSL